MNSSRLVRDGTPLEVSVLAVITLVLGAVCLASAAFPMAADAPRALVLGIGLAALVTSLALLLAGPRVSAVHLHVVVLVFVGLRAAMTALAATERGLMLSALGYTWTAFYAAFFFRPPTARAYAALMTVALAVSFLLARADADVFVWLTISTMVWVAVAVVSRINLRLQALAHTDSLTGLLNRAGFELAAARQRAMSRRRDEPVALVIIDLDSFKAVNDRGGHSAGDRLLVELGRAWTATLRPGDLLARFGGDEFVLMMPGVAEPQIDSLLARLARAHPTAWSAGAVVCDTDETTQEALERADARLYVARKLRRAPGGGEPHAARAPVAAAPMPRAS